MTKRRASVTRKTGETDISATIDLDGTGQYNIDTGNGMLDHLIAQLARHGLFNITIKASGDLETGWHHLVEDTAITLGRAFQEAIGEGKGIVRMAHAVVPLDESLVLVAVDINGRGHASIDVALSSDMVETLPGDLVRHFLESFATEGNMTLHIKLYTGTNSHHKSEAAFKALAKALRQASEHDPRRGDDIPSTKGSITG